MENEQQNQDQDLDEMLRDFQDMLGSAPADKKHQAEESQEGPDLIPAEPDPARVRRTQTEEPSVQNTRPARRPRPENRGSQNRNRNDRSRKKGKQQGILARSQKARLDLFLFLWLSLLYTSVLVRLTTTTGSFFKTGLFLSVFFSVTPALLVYIAATYSKNKKLNKGIVIAYNAIVFALYVSQLIYYKVFSEFYNAMSMGNAQQGLSFMDTLFMNILKNILTIILLLLPLLFTIFLGGHFFSFKGIRSWKRTGVLCGLLVVYHFLTVLLLPIWGGTKEMTPYDMYHHQYDVKMSSEKLGLGTAFRLDLKWSIFGAPKNNSLDLTDDYTKPNDTEDTTPVEPDGTDVPGETGEPGESGPVIAPPAIKKYGYNKLDWMDFDTLIAGENNGDTRELHAYFDSVTPTKQNDHTGMFEGCNLIMLTCESFDILAIDPVLTPTLYKMQTEGMNFTNFYTPLWGVSTTDGEYVHLTGTIPEAGVWSFYRTGENKNYMPLTMCAQLKNLGYCAYAYHNHDYDYYDRDLSHPNMGYIYKGMGNGLEDMGVTKRWPESDVEMIEATVSEYVNQQPFHAYYMTVSGHQYYNFIGNSMAIKNKELVADLPYSETVRAYLATQIELDRAMELLLQKLEEAGVAENTVIVMTADHYPYGLSNEEVSELAGHEVEENFELFKNACIIYKKGMTPETIDWACSSLDVLPTLSNLFGLEFDSRLYMGHDVFSDADPLIIFRNRSWITDQCSYNSTNGEIISFTGEEISDEYVSHMKKVVANKFTVSARILEEDYWRSLFKPE